ncbi:MAG: hypothetical protein HY362_03870 [Candidatus Aenigmarchaeota archaeon]|nr:hypothetical protein [Candidatus Aenigmarchaeota archaeon]
MGRIKYIKQIREFLKKTPVATLGDINIDVRNKNYSYLLVNNMIKRGELNRIKKGFYSLQDDPTLAVFCYRPAYLGLNEALSIHNLWEQETVTIIVTAQKVKHRKVMVFENKVFLHRIKPKYLFGFEMIKQGDFYFPVSDIEKTLIDFVYFNQYLDKETIREFRKRIDREKLNDYLKSYPAILRKRVLALL